MDSRSILGALLGTGVGRSGGGTTSRRLEHAIGSDGSGGSLGGILRDLSAGSGGLGGSGSLGDGSVARGPGAGAGGGLGGLGDLLGGGGRAGGGGLGGALGGGGGGGGGGLGGLGGLLGSVLGGAGGGGLGGALGGALGGGGGRMSPAAAGGLGSLAGAVLGARRGNPMRGAVGAGAIAVLGSLALEALSRRNQQAAAATPGAGAAGAGAVQQLDPAIAVPEDEAGQERLAGLLLRAMMSAAKADGQIDGNEMQRIMGKLDEAGADQETKNIVLDEMRRPLDIKGLAAEARRPEVAAQVYAASLLAIEVDTQAERDYLQRLASALGLDAATVARLHETLGAPAYG